MEEIQYKYIQFRCGLSHLHSEQFDSSYSLNFYFTLPHYIQKKTHVLDLFIVFTQELKEEIMAEIFRDC